MGETKRRWNVTYTKHVKQKRKVYQDGAMEICRSSSGVEKAMLYDDSGKMLESRFLKKDEFVECGGTLGFDSHLVDIGDLERNCEPLKDFDGVGGRGDVKFVDRVGRFGGKRAGLGSSSSIDTGKLRMGRNGASENCQNLIHKDKRGNKEAGQEKTGVSHNCPTPTEISAREWYALYTTQLTQKAKKYHDGTLRLEFRGSHGKQVMLYDATRKILDTRFLKKDEMVLSGETLVFDAHLVDVGDPKENKESALGSVGGQQTHQNIKQDIKKEWHALYTTQKTKKSKNYHDGILRLTVSVCQRKQVTLLNDCGAVLSSKYLNSAEDIQTGNLLEITNYLVDIGEPTVLHGGDQKNHASTWEGETRKGSSLGKVLGSYSSSSNIDKRTANGNDKLIRDAHQILSILKRPIAPQSPVPTNEPLLQQMHPSESSQLQSTIREKLSGQDAQHPNLLKNVMVDDHRGSLQNSKVGNHSKVSTSGSDISHSKAAEDLGNFDIKNLTDNDRGKPKSNASLGLATSDIPASETNVSCLEKSTRASTSSIAKFQVSDTVKLDQPEDVQTPSTYVAHDGLNGSMQVRESHLVTRAESGPSGNDSKITNDDADENSKQLCADMVDDSRSGECINMAYSIPCGSSSSHPNDAEGKSLEMKMDMREEKMNMDDFPSFDLGF